jgi:hypothetical protein
MTPRTITLAPKPLLAAALALTLGLPTGVSAQSETWSAGVSNEGTPVLMTQPEHAFFRFTCTRRGGMTFEATLNSRPVWPGGHRQARTPVVIRAGGAALTTQGRVGQYAGQYVAEGGGLTTASPVFAAFRRAGRIDFFARDLGQVMTPVQADPAVVAEFSRACDAWRGA